MKPLHLMGTALAASVAACGGTKSGTPARVTALDSGQVLEISSLTGGVRNAESTKPTCPIIPHFEAALTVAKLSGTLSYRWERSTGENSKVFEIKLPDSARAGTARVALEPDEWIHHVRGLQQTFTDKVHVLTPVDRISQPMVLQGICF